MEELVIIIDMIELEELFRNEYYFQFEEGNFKNFLNFALDLYRASEAENIKIFNDVPNELNIEESYNDIKKFYGV